MGMFDQYPLFEESFKPGSRFELEGAKLGSVISTAYGKKRQVLFMIDGTVYSALGAGFEGQTERAQDSDFPVEVEYVEQPSKTSGNSPTKLLWPVGRDRPWEQSAPF